MAHANKACGARAGSADALSLAAAFPTLPLQRTASVATAACRSIGMTPQFADVPDASSIRMPNVAVLLQACELLGLDLRDRTEVDCRLVSSAQAMLHADLGGSSAANWWSQAGQSVSARLAV